MMKKTYTYFCSFRQMAAILALLLFIPFSTHARDYEVDGICYELNESTKTLTVMSKYPKKYSGDIIIPESCIINGTTYPVTKIGSFAFSNSDLTSIIMPNSIDTISSNAFNNCKLTNLTIPNSVKIIDHEAFQNCPIETVLLSTSLIEIGEYAFRGCKLTTVVIPNSVEKIDRSAFEMPTLRTAIVGTGIKKMSWAWGPRSSGSRDGLTDIKVFWLSNTPPTGYQDALGKVNYVANDLYEEGHFSDSRVYEWRNKYPIIKTYSFLSSMFTVDGIVYVPLNPSERTCEAIDCTYDKEITEVHFGPTVTYKGVSLKVMGIHDYACYGNQYIKHISFGGDIHEIGDRAFYGCTACEELNVPQTITSIGNEAFYDCTRMKNVCFEDGSDNLHLGFLLFDNCQLDSVYIGRNIDYIPYYQGYGVMGVTAIPNSPFYRNTSLRTVHITDLEDEIYDNEFYGCSGLKNVRIGDGVTTIGDWAFSGCSSLDYFAFGSSVKSIGEEAFSDCTAVTQIISRAATPPTCGNQALDDINKWNCVLKVPRGSVEVYQKAPQWKDFFFVEAGVHSTKTDAGKARYSDLQGHKLSQPVKGLNIVEQKDGTVKKVIIR